MKKRNSRERERMKLMLIGILVFMLSLIGLSIGIFGTDAIVIYIMGIIIGSGWFVTAAIYK